MFTCGSDWRFVFPQRYGEYEEQLSRFVAALEPLLDLPPPDFTAWSDNSLSRRLSKLRQLRPILKAGL